jgi:uncharacterized protein YwgA/O-acetyl-ADP-ribose deacetylase (regulator of RNase III)
MSDDATKGETVEVVIGDLFEADAQTFVNTVNTVGVMGKGVALDFKQRFPEMFADYQSRCARGEVKLGRPYLYRTLFPPYVLNFPTKEHWRSVSKLSAIVEGLEYLKKHYREWGITSLACPPLGCGHGGLEWRIVGPELYRHLSHLDIPVTLFAPFGTPHDELTPQYLGKRLPRDDEHEDSSHVQPSKIPPAWIALVAVLLRLERNPHRYYRKIGRTSFQKLAYFATMAGLPIDLHFAKGSYGPYASGLKAVQSRLVNNGLLREVPSGRMITYSVGPTYEAAERAFANDLAKWDDVTTDVARLMARMTTRNAEVAATVHFVAGELRRSLGDTPDEQQILDGVMEWKARKQPPLDESEVITAIRNLQILGWLEAKPSAALPYEDLAEAAF